MTRTRIGASSTMQEVIDAYPSARRALFTRYHIGGCQSCGYRPEDSLESVAHSHGIADVGELLAFLETCAEQDERLKMSPAAAATALKGGSPPRLLDLRSPQEFGLARIDGAELFTQQINMEMGGWSKDTPILFACHDGRRSMDAAAFFAGHGFTAVRYLEGGIDAWSREIDPSVARYRIDFDPATQQGVLRPLDASFRR